LIQKGWLKRTTIDEPRLSEIIEEYKSLGFEVHVEPVEPCDFNEKCRKCYETKKEKLKTVYIRKKKQS